MRQVPAYIRMYRKCPITQMAMSSLICVILNCKMLKFLITKVCPRKLHATPPKS